MRQEQTYEVRVVVHDETAPMPGSDEISRWIERAIGRDRTFVAEAPSGGRLAYSVSVESR